MVADTNEDNDKSIPDIQVEKKPNRNELKHNLNDKSIDVKQYACSQCDMSFSRASALAWHQRFAHQNIFPHAKYSGSKYQFATHFIHRRHSIAHTGNIPKTHNRKSAPEKESSIEQKSRMTKCVNQSITPAGDLSELKSGPIETIGVKPCSNKKICFRVSNE